MYTSMRKCTTTHSRTNDNQEYLHLLIQRASDILSSEITPERGYNNRREFIRSAATLLATAAGTTSFALAGTMATSQPVQSKAGPYDTTEPITPYQYATTYNNYYEF